MTTYFDPTNAAHKALLPVALRGSAELVRLAAESEADVLNAFTREVATAGYRADALDPTHSLRAPLAGYYAGRRYTLLADGRRGVFLDHYTEDADACTHEAFKAALTRAIALVVAWRIEQLTRQTFVESVSGHAGQNSSVSYRKDHGEPFPRGWDRWLRPYDTRPKSWSI